MIGAFLDMGTFFRRMDSDNRNRKLSFEEFDEGLAALGCKMDKKMAQLVHELFDTDGDGFVNYDEFLIGIRGVQNPRRQMIVDKAFQKFDKTGDGIITIADLKGVYNTKFHPKVIDGEMTEEQVFQEFLQSFGDGFKKMPSFVKIQIYDASYA